MQSCRNKGKIKLEGRFHIDGAHSGRPHEALSEWTGCGQQDYVFARPGLQR